MVFRLFIDTDNDAFQPNPAPELARILRVIADRLDTVREIRPKRQHETIAALDYTDRSGGWLGHYQTIHDLNGNDVGRYAVKPDDKE